MTQEELKQELRNAIMNDMRVKLDMSQTEDDDVRDIIDSWLETVTVARK